MTKTMIGCVTSGAIVAMLSGFAGTQSPVVSYPPHSHAAPMDCCEPCVKKVCVPILEKKKITKTIYDCKCEDFCLPKCLHSYFRKHKCGESCCAECEPPRKRNLLLKKIITTECDHIKCVPVNAPCEPVCAPIPMIPPCLEKGWAPAQLPPVENVPTMPMKAPAPAPKK